jgi:flagellar assembly protein FliH
MPLSKGVLKKEAASNIVLDFTPRSLDKVVPAVAKQFLADALARPSSFKINELVAQQTGISEIERASLQEKIEHRALEKIKEVQEQAYREAYNLGLEEGRKTAFNEEKSQIGERLRQFDDILMAISRIKSDLYNQNEAHLIRLAFDLARKLFFKQIDESEDRILPVLKEAIDLAQSEENVTVRLSDTDYKFIEEFKTKVSKQFDFIKRMKFEPSADIAPGGCILETNYGVIDATIEERVEKLWGTLKEKLPKVKSKNQT